MTAAVGVVGGSGLYRLEGARVLEVVDIPTPFGMPSDAITVMEVAGEAVAFSARGSGSSFESCAFSAAGTDDAFAAPGFSPCCAAGEAAAR